MEWNFKDGIPIYTQIIDEMTMRIASSAYAPGDKLPSVRDLALDAGVNPNTMQRALAELERRGLVYSERTSGRFVTKEEAVLRDLHEELAKKYFEELTEKLRKIGMDDNAIKASVNKWMEESIRKQVDGRDKVERRQRDGKNRDQQSYKEVRRSYGS